MSSRSVFLALVCLFLCFSPGQFVFAAPGDPDVSFGPGTEGGYNSAPAGYPPIGCAVQADGKVLVAGRGYTGEIAVARYLPNGFLDESFGVQGRALASASNLYPMGMRLQADGKTLVLAEDFSSLQKPWLIRFDTDGKLDPTFGSGGKISFQSANPSSWLVEAFDVQPSGKIVVLGDNGGASEMLRFHRDGTADSSFGVNGVAEVSLTGAEGTGGAGFVRSLPDGRLLVAGQIGSDVVVARLQADGAPDATFATGAGIANSFISALILMPDGRFLVAGANAAGDHFPDAMIARFEANGALDTTFGSAGVARLSVVENPGAFENIREIALSPSGKIVVKGFSQLSSY